MIKLRDACLWFKGSAVCKWCELAVKRFPGLRVAIERSDKNGRKLQPFRLVDRHDLHVTLGERLVGVLMLVNPTIMEEAQKAVKELIAEGCPVPVRNHAVVVVVHEDVEQLRENGQVAGPVLVLHSTRKGFDRYELVKIVAQAPVECPAFA